MKNLILIVAAMALALFSCDGKFKFNEKQNAQQKAESSGQTIDTIFLNYRFGMTEKEVEKHTKQLRDNDRLTNNYTYTLKGDIETYDCTIHPKYFEGKLYELTIRAKPLGSTELALLKMVGMVMEKYKVGFVKEAPLVAGGCERYSFFIGNMTINGDCSLYGDAMLTYSQNELSMKAFYMEDSLKKLDKDKTLQDF